MQDEIDIDIDSEIDADIDVAEMSPETDQATEAVSPVPLVESWRPSGALTVEWAAAAAVEAGDALARGVAHVDLEAIERIDTAGCQILLRMAGEARARGLEWRMSGARSSVRETLQRLGCDRPLAGSEGREP
jgi:anti-anti-sigma regulatory factor